MNYCKWMPTSDALGGHDSPSHPSGKDGGYTLNDYRYVQNK